MNDGPGAVDLPGIQWGLPGAEDPRPKAHYPGNVTDVVDQIVGPTIYGEFLAVAKAEYNAATDRTTCWFRYATYDSTRGAR